MASQITQDKDCWSMVEIRPSSGKGMGVFARETIPAGTCILLEKRILAVSGLEGSQHSIFSTLLGAVRKLTKDDFAELLQLTSWNYQRYQALAKTLGIKASLSEAKAIATVERNAWASGLYLKASRFNHSCSPNAAQTDREGSEEMSVLARRDVLAGEEILVSYIRHIDVYSVRKTELEAYQLDCACSACVEPQLMRHDPVRAILGLLRGYMMASVRERPSHEGLPDDQASALRMLDVALAYVSFSASDCMYGEELTHAYQCLAIVYRRADNAKLASVACEQAAKCCTTMRGANHPVTVKFRKAAETLRSVASADHGPVVTHWIEALDGRSQF